MSPPKGGTWKVLAPLFGGTPVFYLECPHCRYGWKWSPSGLTDNPAKYPTTRRCPKCRGKVIYAPQG